MRERIRLRGDAVDRLILTLDASGYPFSWMTWQEAVTHEVAGRVARQLGEFQFTFTGGLCRRTGQLSKVTISSIAALRGNNPHAWRKSTIALTNAALFIRDRYICAYCGKRGSRHLTRDHIVPLSQGGKDIWRNVTTACMGCNHRKGARTPEQAKMELFYVPYAPSLQEGLILENRHILADQMDMLVSMLPKHSRLTPS